MTPIAHLYEVEVSPAAIRGALKQAGIWGLGGAIASKIGQDKEKNITHSERMRRVKDLIAQTGIGAAAGAAGSLV